MMRLLGADPDIETIVSRIAKGDIDLQPNFQRGEVWGDAKKRRLIDTILRDWHVPPIHVIEIKENSKHVVLDGQQRLVAIRDFVNGAITVDGYSQPLEPAILALNGLRYDELPAEWKRKFNQFTIRMFRIIEYKPEEPGEIFYRLNQPTNLTAAESRNAFFGPAREQVKSLVELLEKSGGKDLVGFSNSRMAYDDVLARVCLSLELNTLHEKVTASSLADRYRTASPFHNGILRQVQEAISTFAEIRQADRTTMRFNKATLFSWLWFILRAKERGSITWTPDHISQFFLFFESSFHDSDEEMPLDFNLEKYTSKELLSDLAGLYQDRSTARVADVSSVVYRDIVLWTFFVLFALFEQRELPKTERVSAIRKMLQTVSKKKMRAEQFAGELVVEFDWENEL